MKILKYAAILLGIALIPIALTNCSGDETVLMGETNPPDAPTKNIETPTPDEPIVRTPPTAIRETPDPETACTIAISPREIFIRQKINVFWTAQNAASGVITVRRNSNITSPMENIESGSGSEEIQLNDFGNYTVTATVTSSAAETVVCRAITSNIVTSKIQLLGGVLLSPQEEEGPLADQIKYLISVQHQNTYAGTNSPIEIKFCADREFSDCPISTQILTDLPMTNVTIDDWKVTTELADTYTPGIYVNGDIFNAGTANYVTFTYAGADGGVPISKLKHSKITIKGPDALCPATIAIARRKVDNDLKWIYRNPYVFQCIDLDGEEGLPNNIKLNLEDDMAFLVDITTSTGGHGGTNSAVYLRIKADDPVSIVSRDNRNRKRGDDNEIWQRLDVDTLYNIPMNDFEQGMRTEYLFYINGYLDIEEFSRKVGLKNAASEVTSANDNPDWTIDNLRILAFRAKCGSRIMRLRITDTQTDILRNDSAPSYDTYWDVPLLEDSDTYKNCRGYYTGVRYGFGFSGITSDGDVYTWEDLGEDIIEGAGEFAHDAEDCFNFADDDDCDWW